MIIKRKKKTVADGKTNESYKEFRVMLIISALEEMSQQQVQDEIEALIANNPKKGLEVLGINSTQIAGKKDGKEPTKESVVVKAPKALKGSAYKDIYVVQRGNTQYIYGDDAEAATAAKEFSSADKKEYSVKKQANPDYVKEDVDTAQKPGKEGELNLNDQKPKKEGEVDTAAKAKATPVNQDTGTLDADKNAGKAGAPKLGSDNVTVAPEKETPVAQKDAALNVDMNKGKAGDPNLSKDGVQAGEPAKAPAVNTNAPAGGAPVKQGQSSINKDKNDAKAGAPAIDGAKKVGEGKVPDVANVNIEGIIKDLLEKHGLAAVQQAAAPVKESKVQVNEADLKMDPVQAHVAAGLISYAIQQPKIKEESGKPDAIMNWEAMGAKILQDGLAQAAADSKAYTISGPEVGAAVGLIGWAIKQPGIAGTGIVDAAAIGNNIINPIKDLPKVKECVVGAVKAKVNEDAEVTVKTAGKEVNVVAVDGGGVQVTAVDAAEVNMPAVGAVVAAANAAEEIRQEAEGEIEKDKEEKKEDGTTDTNDESVLRETERVVGGLR